MESTIKFITSWLKDESSHTVDILTISGIGGIGKTSLAKHVYGLHCYDFPKSSYIGDISRTCKGKFNGLLDLQKQLCDDISKKSSIQVQDVSIYTSKIEHAVGRKRVFPVLDDIDSIEQLDALLGSKGFHHGSKIILTTKNKRLTESCALFKTNIKPRHERLLLPGLNETHSRQLLCFHAFMCNHPKEGYKEAVDKLVKYCQGLPLALEVLGKSLHNRDVAYWEGRINVLQKETDSRINNVLKMSFDSLTYKNDKELFKHIACFFVGIDRDVTETILKACDIDTESGMTNLIERCLLSIGQKNELEMHGLVQDMGRSELCQESPDKPWKRSRLWCHDESFKVLKRKNGKGHILGLALDMRMLEKEKLGASFELKTDAFSDMDSLILLQLKHVNMKGSYENFPWGLRALSMHGFHLKSIPLDLPMDNLIALDMSYSNIETFVNCYSSNPRLEKRQKLDGPCLKEKRLLGSLKILNLSFCKQLHSLGDFDQFPALERLIVRKCIGLVKVCESIEQCVELVFIDLSYCNKLENISKIIGMLKKVETMVLEGFNLRKSQVKIWDMDSPEMCEANNIGINTGTSSSNFVGAIPSYLKFFEISLPRCLVTLSLANSNLSSESFPMDFSCLSMLKELCLDHNPIVSMPDCVRTLPRIQVLSMENCSELRSLEHPPQTLRVLMLRFMPSMGGLIVNKIVFEPHMSRLKIMRNRIAVFPGSYEYEGMVKVQPIESVEEKVSYSLGWSNLDLLKKRSAGTTNPYSGIKMTYEFGIFSTMYPAMEMPIWFRYRSVGPSISFTIPNNRIRGLNFCSVHTLRPLNESLQFQYENLPGMPIITISNLTKNRTWIYGRYMDSFTPGYSFTLLSHWMFGMDEMEAGDHITITVSEAMHVVGKECGVSLVYDDGDKMDEEEDALGYYKSWNHIIGGDLTAFQNSTGEYILENRRFFSQEEEEPWFRAFSPRKPGKLVTREGKGESSRSGPSHENA